MLPKHKLFFLGWKCCFKEGFRRIEIESDALLVIKTIEANNWDPSRGGHIFDEIKLIAVQVEEIKFKKIPRLCNGVAHALAKATIFYSWPVFWQEVGPP